MTSGSHTYLYMTSWASAVAGVSFSLSFTSSIPTNRPHPLHSVTPDGSVTSDMSRIFYRTENHQTKRLQLQQVSDWFVRM